MTAKVLKFDPVVVGDGFRFDPDVILEGAKGAEFTTLAVIGVYPDGSIYVAGNANAGETLVLFERAKHMLIFGND